MGLGYRQAVQEEPLAGGYMSRVVRAGDTVSYACGTPHRLSNQTDGVTVATWVIVHPDRTP